MLWQRLFNVFAWAQNNTCYIIIMIRYIISMLCRRFFFTVHNYVPNSGRDQRSHTLLQPTWKSIQLQSVLISSQYTTWARILVQVTIHRRLLIGRDGVSTNQKPTMYRNLYENTGPDVYTTSVYKLHHSVQIDLFKPNSKFNPKIDPGYRYIDTTVELVLVQCLQRWPQIKLSTKYCVRRVCTMLLLNLYSISVIFFICYYIRLQSWCPRTRMFNKNI